MISINAYSQATFSQQVPKVLHVSDWSDSMTFNTTIEGPAIKGYGELSGSLSNTFGGTTFYENNGKYYKINSWADYYYWFTQRFWYFFSRPVDIYENFYRNNHNAGMIWFLTEGFHFEDKFRNQPTYQELLQYDPLQEIKSALMLNNLEINKLDLDEVNNVPFENSITFKANNSSQNPSANNSNRSSNFSSSRPSTKPIDKTTHISHNQ